MLAHTLTAIAAAVPTSLKFRLHWAHTIYVRTLSFLQPLTEVETLSGRRFKWYVDSNSSQEYLRGTYEEHMQAAVLQHVRPGMFVLDVGAHAGFQALLMAASGARVLCFEPEPSNQQTIRQQIKVNPQFEITLNSQALSNRSGTALLILKGSMSRLASETTAEGIEVETRTLDSFRLDLDLIKIDVEGHERQVLEGAIDTLTRCRPIVLCDHNDAVTFQQVTGCLSPLGYEVHFGPPIVGIPGPLAPYSKPASEVTSERSSDA
jgi:FkbM family methyltransferase